MGERFRIEGGRFCMGGGPSALNSIFLERDSSGIVDLFVERCNGDPRQKMVVSLNAGLRAALLLALHAFDDAPESWPQCVLSTHPAPVTGKRMMMDSGTEVQVACAGAAGWKASVLVMHNFIASFRVPDDLHPLTPAPKYRARTAEEWLKWMGERGDWDIKNKANKFAYTVVGVTPFDLVLQKLEEPGEDGGVPMSVDFKWVLDNCEHLDDTPCGTLET